MIKRRYVSWARSGAYMVVAAASLLYATSAFTQQPIIPAPGPISISAVELDQLHWTKVLSQTVESATWVGSGNDTELYIQLVRWPALTRLKTPSHSDGRYVVALKGTFYHGFGDQTDSAKLDKRPAGTFLTEPKDARNFRATKDEGTALYSVGNRPAAIVDPEQ